MILIITLNPLLEKVFALDRLQPGKVHRCGESFYRAGGKGINVSRQLNKLGIQNLSLTFLGGGNGKILRRILQNERIEFVSIPVKAETRDGVLIRNKAENSVTTVIGANMPVSSTEIEKFKIKLEKMIPNCSIAVFMGSSPSHEASSIITNGIELAKKYDKFSFVDTYGSCLGDVLKMKPDSIHNNIHELENSLNITLDSEAKIVEYLHELYSTGIKIALLTDGKNPGYAMQFGFVYKIEQPAVEEIDSQGSGDSFSAGFLYGLEKALVFKDSLKLAASLGAKNASRWDVSNVDLDKLGDYSSKVRIIPLGKKLKLIDDSPTI